MPDGTQFAGRIFARDPGPRVRFHVECYVSLAREILGCALFCLAFGRPIAL